jgi:dTDP-4-dehydrorhamnose 3,5-epimerase
VYHPASDCTIAWNDPELAIDWPLSPGVAPLLSPKDHAGAAFSSATVFA